ncbi:MAG: FGGY family carbohydrate kinase [Pseudomonadota bacterium]
MTAPTVLALDQGTHASRASLWTVDGRCVAVARRPVALRRAGSFVEQDPTELLDSLRDALTEAVARCNGAAPGAAGLATQRSSLLCWNRETGTPLTPVLSWQDTRASAQLEALAPAPEEVRALTGLYPNAHFGASKFRWCLDRMPAVRAAAEAGTICLGPLSTWLVQRLTGSAPWIDPANGARTMLMDRSGRWSDRLLEAFGIDRTWLPEARGSRAPAGTCLADTDIPFHCCLGDQSAVPFGVSAGRGDVLVNLGTGGFVLRRLEAGEAVDERLLETILWQDAGGTLRAAEGTVNGAGAALSWYAERAGRAAPDVDRWLSDPREPTAFLNAVGGIGSPDWRSDVASRFATDTGTNRGGGVVESILFLVRRNLACLGAPGRVVVTGGLAASDALCRRLAALLARPVFRPEATETTSRGVADRLLAGGLPDPPLVRFAPTPVDGLQRRFAAWSAWLDKILAASAL